MDITYQINEKINKKNGRMSDNVSELKNNMDDEWKAEEGK